MEFIGYFSSAFMGVVLGLIGGGGSILTVPILVYLFGLAPVAATGSSLFVVGTTAFVGALGFIRSGRVRFKESLFFAIPSVAGVLVARRLILPHVPAQLLELGGFTLTKDIFLMLMFAALMLVASTKMIRGNRKASTESGERDAAPAVSTLALRGFLVGSVTGFIGAGGGFLIVPALIFLLGFKMPEAVGTSLMIIAVNSLVGFVGAMGVTESPLVWELLLPVTGLAVMGLWAGTKLQKHFTDSQLKKSFGWFVLVIGSLILLDQILRLKMP